MRNLISKEDILRNVKEMSKSVFLGLVLTTLIVVSLILSSLVPVDNTQVQFSSLIVNAVLTLTLIRVYTNIEEIQQDQIDKIEKQADLQKELAEVQRNQTEIMEYQKNVLMTENEPNIQLRPIDINDNKLKYKCQNRGQGLALDVGLTVSLRKVVYNDGSINRLDNRASSLCHPERDELSDKISVGVLQPDEVAEYWFTLKIPTPTKNEDTEELPFSRAITELQNQDVEEIIIEISPYCTDVGGYKLNPFQREVRISVSDNPTLMNVLGEQIPSV